MVQGGWRVCGGLPQESGRSRPSAAAALAIASSRSSLSCQFASGQPLGALETGDGGGEVAAQVGEERAVADDVPLLLAQDAGGGGERGFGLLRPPGVDQGVGKVDRG